MKLKLVIIFFMLVKYSYTQNHISGTVYDKETGETLIGASVVDKATQNGVNTNLYGHFSLEVLENDTVVRLVISYLGYHQFETVVKKSNSINIQLSSKDFDLDEIIVRNNFAVDKHTNQGLYKLLPTELKHMPSLSGETDLAIFLQLLPGVAIAGDGDASVNVRGGGNEQNLFLIDDLPLYYVNHLGGFLSTFNSDVIKSTDFYKSGFPARYGGRLSSVIDVRTNDGNLNNYNIYGTIGLLSSKIGIDGPIVKNKSSFLASFRKNSFPIFKWVSDMDVDYNFYDANFKFNYIISSKERLYFTFFNGNDKVGFANSLEGSTNKQHVSWGNIAGSIRYNRIISSKLYGKMLVGHTTYNYREQTYAKQIYNANIQILNNDFKSSISDNFIELNFEYNPFQKIKFSTGYQYTHHTYVPGKSKIFNSISSNESVRNEYNYPKGTSEEHNLYFQADMKNIYGFDINVGLRPTVLFTNGRTYFLTEPRIMLSKQTGDKLKLNASYDVIHQTFHLITNQGAGIPVEYRLPVLPFAPPEKSNQYSLGISYFPTSEDFQVSLDFYTKQLHNLVNLKDGVNFASSYKNWENIIWANGDGKSKGIELLIRKISGLTTGWIGATFTKAERSFKELNNGNPFPFKYNRPFEFKSYISHQFNKKITANATWVYGSGLPLSIPSGQYYDLDGEVILIYGDRNGLRGEPYHRLDIGLSLMLYPKWGESEWNFSILNLYNRKNPYYYYTDYDSGFNGTGKLAFYKQTLFSFLPSLSYSFKF